MKPDGILALRERETIIDMLLECQGNKSKTAIKLGIGRQTLYDKLKRLDIVFNYHNNRPESMSSDAAACPQHSPLDAQV